VKLGVRWTRHSRILLGAGALYVGIGVSYFYTPEIYRKAPSLKIPLEIMTFTQWGIVYIVVGALAMVSGILKTRKPFGYMLMAALSSAWAAFYIMGVIFEHAPKLTLITGLLFAMLAFIWIQVSGFLSPEAVERTVEAHRANSG